MKAGNNEEQTPKINSAIAFLLPFTLSKIKYGSIKAVQNFAWRAIKDLSFVGLITWTFSFAENQNTA